MKDLVACAEKIAKVLTERKQTIAVAGRNLLWFDHATLSFTLGVDKGEISLDSGIAVSKPVFQLFHTRGGLVTQQRDFSDHSEAIEAAGQLNGRIVA